MLEREREGRGKGDGKGDGWIEGRVVDFVMLGGRERESWVCCEMDCVFRNKLGLCRKLLDVNGRRVFSQEQHRKLGGVKKERRRGFRGVSIANQ